MRCALVCLTAVSVLLAACGHVTESESTSGTGESTAARLTDREFLSTAVTGRALADRSRIRLHFDAQGLGAHAGCNHIGGSWSVEDGVLVVGDLFSTQMACEPPLAEQDGWLAGFLRSRPTITLDGDDLTLAGVEATLVLLDRSVADPDRPLEGTRWQVDTIVSRDAASTIPLGTTASITFSGGRARVEAGCNTGSASAAIDAPAETIALGPLALTKMLCEPPAMELEAAVAAVFGRTVTFEVQAGRLTLKAGEVGLGLAAAE